MIVFHGTTLDAYEEIKNERKLKASNSTISPYDKIGSRKTSYGYVFLTSKLGGMDGAIDYAERSFRQREINSRRVDGLGNSSMDLVVIKLTIADNLLEKDMDDDFADTSFRYNGDIFLENEVATSLHFSNHEKCCKFYDELSNDDSDLLEWNKVLT